MIGLDLVLPSDAHCVLFSSSLSGDLSGHPHRVLSLSQHQANSACTSSPDAGAC